MNYRTALHLLLSLADFERADGGFNTLPRYDLRRMEDLLDCLGNPHLRVPTIHIAGTKGKGSTAAMVCSILDKEGYVTGLFTSPHLHTFRERIRIGLCPISEKEFSSLVEDLWPVVQRLATESTHGWATTFEMLAAMAFYHFSQIGADFQVVEVGLGGRLDATNTVSQPLVCVITPLSLDHTAVLGTTIPEIAREKSGIIKPGSLAITAPQIPEALAVIEAICQTQGAPLVQVAREYEWERKSSSLEGQSFTIRGPNGESHLWTPLLGQHQLENATTAVAVVEAMRLQGISISTSSITRGFREVIWPGRLEVLHHHPVIVVDGAHNPSSTIRLREAVGENLSRQRILLILGSSADKDLTGMVEELVKLEPWLVVATQSRHPRALSTSDIAHPFLERGVAVVEINTVAEAIRFAIHHVSEEDLILATGSLFVVAEVREEVRDIPPELYSNFPHDSQTA